MAIKNTYRELIIWLISTFVDETWQMLYTHIFQVYYNQWCVNMLAHNYFKSTNSHQVEIIVHYSSSSKKNIFISASQLNKFIHFYLFDHYGLLHKKKCHIYNTLSVKLIKRIKNQIKTIIREINNDIFSGQSVSLQKDMYMSYLGSARTFTMTFIKVSGFYIPT